jgi:hypothetical protein
MAYIGDRLFDDVVYANKNKMVSRVFKRGYVKVG